MTIQLKITELSSDDVYYALRGVPTFENVDEIIKCGHSNKSYRPVLSCGAVYYAINGSSNIESVDEIVKCELIQMNH